MSPRAAKAKLILAESLATPARFTLPGPDGFLRCCNFKLLRQCLKVLGFETVGQTDDALATLYMTRPGAAALSPNPYFDEQWYLHDNPDIAAAIGPGGWPSGFVHYVNAGLFQGRWPNPVLQAMAIPPARANPAADELDTARYISANPDAATFLRHFPILPPLLHYNLFGRFTGAGLPQPEPCKTTGKANYFELIAAEFDPSFYVETYFKGQGKSALNEDPLTHYLVHGVQQAYSPNASFDEQWYRSFYPEIRMAIARGEVMSGFYHYIVAGRDEGRLPKFNRKLALEARMPGVTKPVLLHRIPDIRKRLAPRQVKVKADAPAMIWFLIPTMNPDITFGGYRSAFELINAAREAGYEVGIFCMEDAEADKEYFLWRETSPVLRELVRNIQIINQANARDITIGPDDTVVVYSILDLYVAEQMRKAAPRLHLVLLAQEYEPIFHDNCAIRAIAEEAYQIPHYPLINSQFLCDYLKAHRVGVFGKPTAQHEGKDYTVFEHRITKLPAQNAASMRARDKKYLVAYARPESHAARNMFEILVLALELVCAEGLFGPEWQFIGLGTLTDMEPVPIYKEHKLILHPKMTEEEYQTYISSMDIGVSLMFAPHPSVVPFEFATTGAIVVTNTYENRSADSLRKISKNIIAGSPSIEGIAAALRLAAARVNDTAEREKHIYQPNTAKWREIFNDHLLRQVFEKSKPKQPQKKTAAQSTGSKKTGGLKAPSSKRTELRRTGASFA